MESFTKYLFLLAICVILMPHQSGAIKSIGKDLIDNQSGEQETKGKDLIQDVCAKTPDKDLCVEVLSSDPTSENANLQELAMISLRVASSNASGILKEVKVMIDDSSLDPGVQQGLADCQETVLDAETQLEDTIGALLVNAKRDAQVWLHAALAAIDTCDASIPGDDDILSRMSVGFRQLCNIAMAISKTMTNPA